MEIRILASGPGGSKTLLRGGVLCGSTTIGDIKAALREGRAIFQDMPDRPLAPSEVTRETVIDEVASIKGLDDRSRALIRAHFDAVADKEKGRTVEDDDDAPVPAKAAAKKTAAKSKAAAKKGGRGHDDIVKG